MVTCTAGKPVWTIGPMAQVALSAEAAKCASTTLLLPRIPWLQRIGTTRQTIVHLTVWWHKAISLLVGCVTSVATNGMQHPFIASAKLNVVAQSALRWQTARTGPSNQPLQSARTLKGELSWQSGIMCATHLRGTFPTTPVCKATSQSSGSAPSAQQGSNTDGLLCFIIELAAPGQAVHSVLGRLLANATPCKRSTLK